MQISFTLLLIRAKFKSKSWSKISQAVPNFLKHYYFRSSHMRCSVKKDVFKNFAKFTRKHLCQRLFFNKVAGQVYNFIKKESLVQVLSCEFCEISKNIYRTPPDDCFCYFHIKQLIVPITHITHARMQMATQSLYKYIS